MDTLYVCEGPQHVIVAVNESGIESAGFDPTGMPAREAFPGYDHLQRLMDVCYRTGEEQVVYMDGATWLTFRWDGGVATALRLHRADAIPQPTGPLEGVAA